MIKKVLYPTDFSKASEGGTRILPKLKLIGLEQVVLTHVVDLNRLIGPVSGIDIPAIIHDYEEESKENLLKFAKLIEGYGLKVVMDEIRIGEPSLTICDVAVELFVDAIVIPSHGKGFIEEILLGSVSEGVVRRSKKPVIVVKTRGEEEPDFGELFRNILFAYDFSELSERLKDYVKLFVNSGKCEKVIIVHVVEKSEELSEEDLKKLEEIDREFESMGVESELVVEGGTPYKEILKVAEKKNATMICIASIGRGLISSLMGGTADNVVRRSKVPVFVLKK